MRNFFSRSLESVNPDSSPGIPYMFWHTSNASLTASDNKHQILPGVFLTMREIVINTSIWMTYCMCTKQYNGSMEALADGATVPFRPFVKGECTKMKKKNENGTIPRLIINGSLALTLSSHCVYNDTYPNVKKEVGQSAIMLGFGISKSILQRVFGYFERKRAKKYPAVSNDVSGWEKGVSLQLMLIAVSIYFKCFVNANQSLWNYLVNYAILCCDCVYFMPDGEIVQKVIASLMPSGILLTAILNSICRFFLSLVMGCRGIFMGDDACEYTADPEFASRIAEDVRLNIKADEQVVLTDDHLELIDGLHFCSAVIYSDGSQSPVDSSLKKSLLSSLSGLKKTTFQDIVQANAIRCTTPDSFNRLLVLADELHSQILDHGLDVDFDPMSVIDVTNRDEPFQLVFE